MPVLSEAEGPSTLADLRVLDLSDGVAGSFLSVILSGHDARARNRNLREGIWGAAEWWVRRLARGTQARDGCG